MAPKYRLDPEALAVESFATDALKGGEGTVFGQQDSYPRSESTCFQILCGCTYAGGTCDLSCMGDPCEPTNVNCNGCGGGTAGCSGAESCGCQTTNVENCCTGFQAQCSTV